MSIKMFIIKNRKILLIVVLILIVGTFHYKMKRKPDEEKSFSFSKSRTYQFIDEIAPNFQFKLLNGTSFSLADVIGKKIIILNFFATWCQPCRDELPYLNSFYNQHKDNLVMIGIVSEESEEKIRNFIEETKVNFPVGIDTDGTIANKYEVDSFPTTVLIGPNGRIYFYEIGAIYNTKVTLEPVYKNLLKMLNSGTGISKETYLKIERASRHNVVGKEEKIVLTEREKAIAKRIYCPRGCGKNLIDCDCSLCRHVIKEIREEIKNNKSDEEIIKSINIKYCNEK